jgi:hypothetical protein
MLWRMSGRVPRALCLAADARGHVRVVIRTAGDVARGDRLAMSASHGTAARLRRCSRSVPCYRSGAPLLESVLEQALP